MKVERMQALDRRVAVVLNVGTWLASVIIALGIVLPRGLPVIMTGIALLIALPIVRVTLVMIHSLRARDRRMAAICAAVLLIIAFGIVLSVRTHATGG
jgi:uncharacterized membrane protein